MSAWVARVRWRRRGAWMWPAFVAFTVLDAVIGHTLPPTGQSQSLPAAVLLGAALNLAGVIVLSWPVSLLLRRVRPDLPAMIARDYAGSFVIVVVTAGLLFTGIAHRSSVLAQQQALRDASVRAEAWIGAHAPAQFMRNAALVNTFTIEPGRIYRSCVPGAGRSYCVVIRMWLPSSRSVSFAGYEPNSVFGQGVG